MAKIKFGTIVTDASGKVGGNVFSRNRSGNYLSKLVKPINTNTLSQKAVRATFSSFSQQWAKLTQIQRDAWNKEVVNYKYTDYWKKDFTPSGKNLFVKLNMNKKKADIPFSNGENCMAEPPAKVSGGVLELASMVIVTNIKSILLTYKSSSDITKYVFYATAPLSAGISSPAKAAYKIIGSRNVLPTENEYDYYDFYSSVFGGLGNQIGKKIFLKVVGIDVNSGVEGVTSYISAIVE